MWANEKWILTYAQAERLRLSDVDRYSYRPVYLRQRGSWVQSTNCIGLEDKRIPGYLLVQLRPEDGVQVERLLVEPA